MTDIDTQQMLLVNRLFDQQKRDDFDFSEAPLLIRMNSETVQTSTLFSEQELSQWTQTQDILLRWTRDRQIFNPEYVHSGKSIYDNYFKIRPMLRGNVVDIGGGWGLFREWWEGDPSSVFIVHDPGVDRFSHGAHDLHRELYARAFSLPMTFVEGFGEELPYQDGSMDMCLIASALDHCVDPKRVFAETYRCLKSGGSSLIIQQCDAEPSNIKRPQRSLPKRIFRLLTNPQHALAALRVRLFYREPHLHHFSVGSIQTLLEEAGYMNLDVSLVPNTANIYAFEATRS